MRRRSTIGVVILSLALLAAGMHGGAAQTLSDSPLRIGTKAAPPFAMQRTDGTWHGMSIALWQRIATELGLRYAFIAHGLQGLLDGVKDGSLDAAVAALTITAEREILMDFTYAYHVSGLGKLLDPERYTGECATVAVEQAARAREVAAGIRG